MRSRLLTVMLSLPLFTAVSAQEDRSEERTLAPYFYVAGGDPETERLPLKETRADVQIAGPIARVRVSQAFANDGEKPIEAIYVFPASTRAAVHGMRMRIGQRVVEARIDRKQAARADYEQARREGRRASLLEQQRANVFTMSVANVMPGDRIDVDLDYSELLVPENSAYEFVFPGVVGPRYPGGADPKKDSWIGTPYLTEGTAEPFRFDLKLHLEAGVPIRSLSSPSHALTVARPSPASADVGLGEPGGSNRDFILRYQLSGDAVDAGLLLWDGGSGGENFFAVVLEPPSRPRAQDVPAREFVFVLDVSGSMYGFPLDVAKDLMSRLLAGLRTQDRFNVVLFAGASAVMSPDGSVAATAETVAAAVELISRQQGGGGTELMGALQSAYAIPMGDAARTVVVVTDGYVGVEDRAFRFVRERLDQANLFAFGIGASVNRALIEAIARAGVGAPFVVQDEKEAGAQAERFRAYIETPVLTDVAVEFSGFDAYDIAPTHIPDLMARRPLVVFGKYRGAAEGKIAITGRNGAGGWRKALAVAGGAAKQENTALRWLWARSQVAELEDELAVGASNGHESEITDLGLRYSLLTTFTSFVALDQVVANQSREWDTAKQPLPLPRGVSNLAVGNAASVSRQVMPPGDPILSVAAPRDARSVTAAFAFGLVKELAWDPYTEQWQTRFLVPKDTLDGDYRVPVVIVHADGRTETVSATYRVDSAVPDFELAVQPVDGGVRVHVKTAEPARQVAVALVSDPSVRATLAGDGTSFSVVLPLPPGLHRLRVVVADLARNEADALVGCEVR